MGWITDICGRASRGQTWTATVIMLGHQGITELQKYRLLIGVDRTSLQIEHIYSKFGISLYIHAHTWSQSPFIIWGRS